jgi:hypothetical protein
MPFIAQHWCDSDATGLPEYWYFDAEEYNDTSIRNLRPVGKMWITGVSGVTGKYMPTGWRWQLEGTGMLGASEEMPLSSYPEAIRAASRLIMAAAEAHGLY